MSDVIETINYRGHEIEVCYDQHADSPDEWKNDDAFIVYDHRQFYVKRDGFDPEEIFEAYQAGKPLFDGYHYFPLYAYIHSGVSLSLGRGTDRWDTSFKGFVLVQKVKGWTWRRDKAYKVAEGQVKTWNLYLSGQVYGYNSEFGGCWGFYGDEGKAEMIKEAKAEIDYELKEKATSHFNQLKQWIKNKVPLIHRKQFAF